VRGTGAQTHGRTVTARTGAPAHWRTVIALRALLLCACCVCAFVRLAAAQQCPDGTPAPCARSGAAAPARSVAVLTFENLTRDTSAQYLAEGLPDQILARLGGVERLTVVSRTVVRRLRNADQLSVQQIGRALNVAFLVNGTIRAAGGRVRLQVEALRAGSGEAIWSRTFDRAADSLLGIEEAVASEVAAGVAGRLSPQEQHALGSRVTADSRAYDQFVLGNFLLARRTPASLQGAIAAYRAATAADSGMADAYARLAYAYALCALWACSGDADSLQLHAREAATRALRLNPRSSDAWMGRAYLLTVWSLNFGMFPDDSLLAALAAFRRALELNPRNDEAWHQYGSTLGAVSDSASLDALRRALAVDPARAITYTDLALTYYRMGRNDRARSMADSAVALEPDGPFRSVRVLFRLTAGDTAGAVADARLTPSGFCSLAVLAAIAHDSAAVRAVEAMGTQSVCGGSYPLNRVLYLMWTGRHEQAVQYFVKCGPSLSMRWRVRLLVLAPLAEDPRIQALRAESERILARARWR